MFCHRSELLWPGIGACSLRKVQKLCNPDWLKLTLSHEERNKIYEFSPNFYLEESRFLYERA